MDQPHARGHASGRQRSSARAWNRAPLIWTATALLAFFVALTAARQPVVLEQLVKSETVIRWHLAAGSWVHLGASPVDVTPGAFTTQQFSVANEQPMTYYLYVPQRYQPTSTYPIVLLLHGVGESAVPGNAADQNRSVLIQQQYVQAWVAQATQARHPCFVVVPQVSGGTHWADVPGTNGSYAEPTDPTTALQTAMDIVLTVEANYPSIDQHRLYIVGISMGANGVWDAIERWSALFAAAAPLAGTGDPARAAAVAQLPIWDFQGGGDAGSLVVGSHNMFTAIHAAGGNSCYTTFPGQGHDLWNTVKVYQSTTFQQWLFSQTSAPHPTRSERPLTCGGLSIDGIPALGGQLRAAASVAPL